VALMRTVNFKKSCAVSFKHFLYFSQFVLSSSPALKFFQINHRLYALNLPCSTVTAVLVNCSTSKKNSLQKFKNVSSLCSRFVSAILMV